MATKAKTLTVSLGSTNTSPTNNILAADSAHTIYIRSIHPVNNDTSARTWSFAVAAAAITAANGQPFAESLAISSRANPTYFGGKGLRVDNTALSAVASVASVVELTINYDISDTVDA
jgi:hypothetical protein